LETYRRLLLVVAVAELGGEPVAEAVLTVSVFPASCPISVAMPSSAVSACLSRACQGFGAGGVGLVLLDLGGGDECGELGSAPSGSASASEPGSRADI
jgi:hypothetical protein